MKFQTKVDGLDVLAKGLQMRSETVRPKVRASTFVAARKIKDDARQRATGMSHLPRYPYSITFDLDVGFAGVTAEIGPTLGGQGSLGHLIEYGTATSGPNPHMGPAADAEIPIWLGHLGDIAGDV